MMDIIYRKYDSDDICKIRSNTITTDTEGDKAKVRVDTGMLQKVSICLGVKSCPWFNDIINEDKGVTQEIFNKRMFTEFRKIPVDIMDKMFKEAQEYNKADFDAKELQKK
jgi:hypothetical protein